jgi:hypothetical protein
MKRLTVVLLVLSSLRVLAAPPLGGQGNVFSPTAAVDRTDSDFLLQLAEAGNAQAQAILGEMHLGGKGVPKDYSSALRWFRASAEQGDAEALRKMGFMYESGLGVEKNPALAAKWYRRARDEGDFLSFYMLGFGFVGETNIP